MEAKAKLANDELVKLEDQENERRKAKQKQRDTKHQSLKEEDLSESI